MLSFIGLFIEQLNVTLLQHIFVRVHQAEFILKNLHSNF